ncbi:ANTAR domain-containing protein [Geodermatophilus sp. URMC 64]
MTIAGRFEDALVAASEPGSEGPELLPVRLARAVVRMLPVDGAGISLAGDHAQRIPLGASSEAAAMAERLQFTVGAGPCMAAQTGREPVFALHEDLRRRWPPFADLLAARTPYCAVVALPLREAIAGLGAIDLYFTRDDAVAEVDVFEALAVGDLITSALSETAVWSVWSPARGPEWLHGPAAERRAAVWEAMGTVSLHLDVDPAEALAVLRGAAYASGRSVDDVAADVLAGRMDLGDLDPPEESASADPAPAG